MAESLVGKRLPCRVAGGAYGIVLVYHEGTPGRMPVCSLPTPSHTDFVPFLLLADGRLRSQLRARVRMSPIMMCVIETWTGDSGAVKHLSWRACSNPKLE